MNLSLLAMPVLFAQMGGKSINDILEPQVPKTHVGGDAFPVMTAIAVVVVIVAGVVIFLRRKKIRRLGSLSRSAWPASASRNKVSSGTLQRREHRHHRHRKRREHRPRNPTLADTGGLPPLRPEDEAPTGL